MDPNSLAIALVLCAAAVYAVVRYVLPAVGIGGETLFVLHVRNGRVSTARGKPPARLVHDFEDVVQKPPVKHATITVKVDGPRARLTATGTIDEGRLQRLRNVLGLYPLARLR